MLRFILVFIVAFAGYYLWAFFPITHGPGITNPHAPETSRITWEKPFPYREYTITPLRNIEGETRVIERKRYYFDSKSEYAPVDVLVGWSDLSDERNLDHLHFSLDNRVADVEYSRPPLPVSQIYKQTALWHLVPSNEAIEKEIKKIRNGNILRIKGFIVNIDSEVDYGWRSDITPAKNEKYNNTIIWVTEVSVR
jgi:hypothetical protein